MCEPPSRIVFRNLLHITKKKKIGFSQSKFLSSTQLVHINPSLNMLSQPLVLRNHQFWLNFGWSLNIESCFPKLYPLGALWCYFAFWFQWVDASLWRLIWKFIINKSTLRHSWENYSNYWSYPIWRSTPGMWSVWINPLFLQYKIGS